MTAQGVCLFQVLCYFKALLPQGMQFAVREISNNLSLRKYIRPFPKFLFDASERHDIQL